MTDPFDDPDFDNDIARAADLPPLDPDVRAAILSATTQHVRRRRYTRHLWQAAALVAAFISGALLMPRAQSPAPVPVQTAAVVPDEAVLPTGLPQSPTPIYDDPEAFAMVYDAASPDERLDLLKDAGDYALNVEGDIRTAIDYYKLWIDLADDAARRQYNRNDTWLLASLKHYN